MRATRDMGRDEAWVPCARPSSLIWWWGELGLHRVEVCVRPENERSLGVCRGLGLIEEGLRPRFMHIAGQWADHVAFFIDSESLPEGGLVQRRWGSPAIS